MTAAFDQYPHERRRSPRVDAEDVKVEYYSAGNEASPTISSVKNICIHGICICMENINEGWKTIHLNISPPGCDTPLSAVGTVVWYNMLEGDDHYSVGIEFEQISEDDQMLIGEYVKAKLEE